MNLDKNIFFEADGGASGGESANAQTTSNGSEGSQTQETNDSGIDWKAKALALEEQNNTLVDENSALSGKFQSVKSSQDELRDRLRKTKLDQAHKDQNFDAFKEQYDGIIKDKDSVIESLRSEKTSLLVDKEVRNALKDETGKQIVVNEAQFLRYTKEDWMPYEVDGKLTIVPKNAKGDAPRLNAQGKPMSATEWVGQVLTDNPNFDARVGKKGTGTNPSNSSVSNKTGEMTLEDFDKLPAEEKDRLVATDYKLISRLKPERR